MQQELLAAVGRELNLPADDSLLAPIAALEAPSFAAAPAFQAPLPVGTGDASDESPFLDRYCLSQ